MSLCLLLILKQKIPGLLKLNGRSPVFCRLTRTVKAVVAVAERAVNCRIPVRSWALMSRAGVPAKSTGYVLLTVENILATNRSSSRPGPAAIGSMKQRIKTAPLNCRFFRNRFLPFPLLPRQFSSVRIRLCHRFRVSYT